MNKMAIIFMIIGFLLATSFFTLAIAQAIFGIGRDFGIVWITIELMPIGIILFLIGFIVTVVNVFKKDKK